MFDTNVETGKEKPNGTVWKESKERREEKGRGEEMLQKETRAVARTAFIWRPGHRT